MSSNNFMLSCRLCRECREEMASAGISVCKNCKPKREYNRVLDKSLSKKYLLKFENKSSSNKKEIIQKTKVPIFYSTRFRLNKEIVLQVNIEEENSLFGLYWDEFRDFDSFSNFISKSGKIKKSKFQRFIQSKEGALPNTLSSAQLLFSIPYSRPLQLLGQSSYWNDLMESYFQNIHPRIPLFSIRSFNPKTASKFLLSGIYYGGFLFTQYKPFDLVSYFSEYSKQNAKDISKVVSLQSTQAMAIYSFLFVIDGNYTLSKHCQSQAIRMSYTIGLHLNLKKLTPILRYNRLKLFSIIFTVHISCHAISQFALNQITEYEDFNILSLNPEYQIPNPNCAFYLHTEDENIVYGYCADTYSRIYYMVIRFLWAINKCSEKNINREFDKIFVILLKIMRKLWRFVIYYHKTTPTFNLKF
ncbi:hypothetical protein CONCODRAFT_11516 [Conidiobolus coronatus NRRL 28638]|uniref:Xylanolytic transcriptional activator regulatory domain-containing protein n=1 Tax=Conidiobolus coronatus (strain ATCC 28846 / CBS 209.66 / NRRL 28638) TaxID=796925 RepID=A0A137NV31_CONC2|nr:hypothetical protein CONCODRAFT_11516 [Conidiobolus coronatus NRRL 28638]|eukprot:KXN66592.1 hypothetical protein CONCODRAFT_11516 [Conidiobolus coronatus NRRL 28638]